MALVQNAASVLYNLQFLKKTLTLTNVTNSGSGHNITFVKCNTYVRSCQSRSVEPGNFDFKGLAVYKDISTFGDNITSLFCLFSPTTKNSSISRGIRAILTIIPFVRFQKVNDLGGNGFLRS